MNKIEMRSAFAAASKAGAAAAKVCEPEVMYVRDALNPDAPVWKCDDGMCGFGWVHIPDGRSAAARYAKANYGFRSSAYEGGVMRRVHEYGQSYERKMAFARAYAKVLRENGIEARAGGRLD